ncbi:MAG: DUF3782 domain-containing protein [Candidatus Caldarchaeum sp.]
MSSKEEFLRLLKEDQEFRYAVAGLIGFKEVLERIDNNTAAIKTLQEEVAQHSREIKTLQEQVTEHSKAIQTLQQEVAENTRAIKALQEQVAELSKDIKALQEQVAEHGKAIKALQSQVAELGRALVALGARWGLMAESSFREAMKNIVERVFGGTVDKWARYDYEGLVYGRPAIVEVDLIIKDDTHLLVEVKSSISRGDVAELLRKAQRYEREVGVKPMLAIVSPYVADAARKLAEELAIEVYTALS